MPACRKTHNANFAGVNIPFLSSLTNQFNGLLCILQRPYTFILHDRVRRQAVFQHKSSYAMFDECLCNGLSFRYSILKPVSATRTDHHSSSVGCSVSWKINGNGWLRYIP